jgi:hypothetical protein
MFRALTRRVIALLRPRALLHPGVLLHPEAPFHPETLLRSETLLHREAPLRPEVLAVPPPSGPLELAANRAIRVPPQAHRAPYLEDIDDWS